MRSSCVFISENEQIAPLDLALKDKPKSKWDYEDVDENDVRESWGDEDELALVRILKKYCLLFAIFYQMTYIAHAKLADYLVAD